MSNKYLLSICVPTYNHASLLEDFFQSLKQQAFKNFELVIVNDGSTDNTDDIISHWKNLELFSINYMFQKNMGRAQALKKAILNATGEYTIIMDSDDYFYANAFNIIYNSLNNLKNYHDSSLAGICGLCSDKNSLLIGNKFPKNEMISNLIEIRADYNIKGDKKEVIKTELLQKNMYDFDIRIRRVPTSILWTRVSKNHKVLFINEFIVYKDYLESGLTKNINKVRANNAISSAKGYFEQYNLHNISYKSTKHKYKMLLNYWRYYFHGGKKEKLKMINNLFAPLGYILYLKDRFK